MDSTRHLLCLHAFNLQVGDDFSLEIVEGPADARRSHVVREGLWQTAAGQPLEFKILCHDGAGNMKCTGGDQITVADATVTSNDKGTYNVTWARTSVGFHKVLIMVNGEWACIYWIQSFQGM